MNDALMLKCNNNKQHVKRSVQFTVREFICQMYIMCVAVSVYVFAWLLAGLFVVCLFVYLFVINIQVYCVHYSLTRIMREDSKLKELKIKNKNYVWIESTIVYYIFNWIVCCVHTHTEYATDIAYIFIHFPLFIWEMKKKNPYFYQAQTTRASKWKTQVSKREREKQNYAKHRF